MADSPSDSPTPGRRGRSRKRRAEAPAAPTVVPNSSGGRRKRQQKQLRGPAQAGQPQGLARLLRQVAAPSRAAATAAAGGSPAAGAALLQGLSSEAANGHQPPHLMKTSQYRWAGTSGLQMFSNEVCSTPRGQE